MIGTNHTKLTVIKNGGGGYGWGIWHTCVQDSVGEYEGNSLLGRPKHRCQHNIKMEFRETEWERVDSIHLVQYRDKSVVNPGTQCSIISFRST